MLRVVGIVARFVLAACDQTSVKVGPSPSPVIAQGSWTQNLTLTGDLPGQIVNIVPDQGTQQTFCSGSKVRNGETWSDSFYASVDSSGSEWQLNLIMQDCRGPGTCTNKDEAMAVQAAHNPK